MEYSKILGRLRSIHEMVVGSPRAYMDAFDVFDEIPAEHRNFLDLAYWLTLKDRSIEQIPEHARTDRLMFFHLAIKPHRFESITPSSKRYYAICEFAMWRTGEVLRFVPVVFITESLVRRLTVGDSRHSPLDILKMNAQFDHLYTRELIELTLGRSLNSLHWVNRKGLADMVSPQSITERLSKAHHDFGFAVRYVSDLLQQAMRDGFWFEPTTPGGNTLFGEEPKTPSEVLALWVKVRKTWATAWLAEAQKVCAFKMNCFDDSEVVHEMVKSDLGRQFLQRFYSDERVKVFFNDKQAVRGYILEQELAV